MSQTSPPDDDFSNVRLQRAKRFLALLWTGGILLSVANTGLLLLLAVFWQLWQSNDKLLLDQAKAFQVSKNHQACLEMTGRIPADSWWFKSAQLVEDQCQNELAFSLIEQAKTLADNRQLKEALELIRGIDSPAHQSVVNQLKQEWSRQILNIAEYFYQNSSGDPLADAIVVANVIPPDCQPVYSLAQLRILQWQQEWAKNANHLQTARNALAVDDLNQAHAELSQLTVPFWLNQAQPLLQQITIRQGELTADL